MVGRALAQPLVARVTTATGEGVGGVRVTWAVTAGGGVLSATSVATDPQGLAEVTLTLGTTAGTNTDSVTASAGALSGSPVSFSASATAAAPVQLARVSGDSQTGTVGQSLPQPLVVLARDQYDNPVSGAGVAWAVTAGAGSLSAASVPTNDQGQSFVSWTPGPTAGTQGAAARIDGASGSSVAFTVRTLAGPASGVSFKVQPSNTAAGRPITPAVEVAVVDAFGNTVPSATNPVDVALATSPSGGALTGTKQVTAVTGVSSFSDLSIDRPGNGYTLSAKATGLTGAVSAGFDIDPLPPTQLVFTGQPGTAAAGMAITPPVQVTAREASGKTATGFSGTVTVAIAANPTGGTLSGATTVAAAAGVATFQNLRIDRAGVGYTLTASTDSLTATSASFNVTAGVAALMFLGGGDNQTAPAGTALPVPYSVYVTDAFGNKVSGVAVSWVVGSGGGSANPTQSNTDSNGVANTTRILGPNPGAQTAFATVAGLTGSPVPFMANAMPNAMISGTITLVSTALAPPLATVAAPRTMEAPLGPRYTPNELIVTFRAAVLSAPPVGALALAVPAMAQVVGSRIRAHLASSSGSTQFEITGVSPATLAARVRLLDSTRLDETIAQLLRNPEVETVERNAIVRLDAREHSASSLTPSLPNDPLYPWQAWHYGMIDLPRAWGVTTGSAAVLVAVVDNGIRFDHPAIAANLTRDGYDFVTNEPVPLCAGGTIGNAGDGGGYDPDPTQPADYGYDDVNNCATTLETSGDHGLHVAGTIGAVGNDGLGVTGVNWAVRIRPVRVLGVAGFGSFYDIAQGLLYAAGLPADNGAGGTVQAPTGARIINLSLGGPSGSTALKNAVTAASTAGALIVAAAGNSGTSAKSYPAAYSQVLSVSAVGPDGVLASYSSYGSTVDIAAPGGDVADGGATFGVMSTAWNYVAGVPIYDGTWDGTSMATPHVSGVAALLLAQNPSLTGADLRSRLTTYAVDAGAAGRDDFYGAGILNARNSLTQSFAPPRQLYARLYDASTGAIVQTVTAAANGSYAFTGLANGGYFVFAGTDEDNDQQLGVPGRLWGSFGGSAKPTVLTVAGAGTYPASFSVGLPIERESNNVLVSADVLSVPGYLNGTISSPSTDIDFARVLISQAGQYTFETSGTSGACGFALEENTILDLYDGNGNLISSNDDISPSGANYCSRITATLSPGAYYLATRGHSGLRYRLQARPGS